MSTANHPNHPLDAAQIQFVHETIDPNPPCARLSFCLATDLTGNGRDDVIVGAMGSQYTLSLKGAKTRIPSLVGLKRKLGFPETQLFWYENPGWKRHKMASVERIDVGHALADIDGDGRLDLVAGQSIGHNHVYWFRQPEDPRDEWDTFVITDKYEKYHDVGVADVDDDGELEVVGLSQQSETVFYYDIPDDPTQQPWPDECHHVVAEVNVEGLAAADVDGDGRTELIAGMDVYHRNDDGTWTPERIASGWDYTRVAVADFDGDGDPELVFSEGDSPTYGTHPGRVAVFDRVGGEWTPTVLRDDLFHPHSLVVADFDGDGSPDIFVGEMGLDENPNPTNLLFHNDGAGNFTEQVFSEGIPTHEAKAAQLTPGGLPSIVGKSYGPNHHVDAWYNDR